MDLHLHHNFGNFTENKISLKKVQSSFYTVMKKKSQSILLAVMLTWTISLATFRKYPECSPILDFWTFKKKSPIGVIYLGSCYRRYTENVLNSFTFLLYISILLVPAFSQHFLEKSHSVISWIYNEKDIIMDSLSLPKWLQINFDRSHGISGASQQNRFYRVCRVKANAALKPKYLLKC